MGRNGRVMSHLRQGRHERPFVLGDVVYFDRIGGVQQEATVESSHDIDLVTDSRRPDLLTGEVHRGKRFPRTVSIGPGGLSFAAREEQGACGGA